MDGVRAIPCCSRSPAGAALFRIVVPVSSMASIIAYVAAGLPSAITRCMVGCYGVLANAGSGNRGTGYNVGMSDNDLLTVIRHADAGSDTLLSAICEAFARGLDDEVGGILDARDAALRPLATKVCPAEMVRYGNSLPRQPEITRKGSGTVWGGCHQGLPSPEVLMAVLDAKIAAENAPGVGRSTDLAVINRNECTLIPRDRIHRLKEISALRKEGKHDNWQDEVARLLSQPDSEGGTSDVEDSGG